MFQQLTEQDAGFLFLESPETPQHMGSVSFVELPPAYEGSFYEAYKRHIGSRLHLAPMLTRKLVPLPYDIDLPFWTDDEHVDLDYHVRHHTLPRPGRQSQLEELVGRLHSHFLDRSRPLWEFYVIDGLDNGQVAIYTKIHHAAMDGAATQALIAAMYDPSPAGRELPPPERVRGKKKPRPGLEDVLRGVVSHLARQEIRAVQYVPEALAAWSHLLLPDTQTLDYQRPALPPLMAPHTLFNVGITSQRAFAARSVPLSRVKRMAKAADARVNDVVLALVAGVLRRYLHERHALPRLPLTAMVPVSLHAPGEPAQGNQNAALLCSLATDLAAPYRRLLAIREGMADQKRLLRHVKNVLLPDLSVLGGGAIVRGLVDLYRRARLADRLPPLYNLVISNVPGPTLPLYIVGARVLSFNPCSIPFHGTALNVTVESYCDALDFGFVACRRTVPDLSELADLLAGELDALEQATARAATTPAKASPAGAGRKAAAARAASSAPSTTTPTPATARARHARRAALIHPGAGKHPP